MENFLTKLFVSITTARLAWGIVLTCLGVFVGLERGVDLAKTYGISENYTIALLIFFMYSASIIVIAIALYFWNLANIKRMAYLKAKYKLKQSQAQLELFQIKIRGVIPLLPSAQINLLEKLSESDMRLDSENPIIRNLEREGLIKQIYKIDYKHSIFSIASVVATELASYFEQQRKERLEKFVLEITSEQREFLQLFYSETVKEGTEESQKIMSFRVFQAGRNMAPQIIEHFQKSSTSSNTDAFRLPQDTAEILKKSRFENQYVRDEVFLDTNWIEASRISGSGTLGSNYL